MSADSNFQKPYRTYYISGEQQAEGYFLEIDKYDDSRSVFDGKFLTFYKSGDVEQSGSKKNGELDGEYTLYGENKLIIRHATYSDGKLTGICTDFSDDGTLCNQTEYLNGEPVNDFYIASNSEGYCSKVRLSDDTPIFESPSIDGLSSEFKDGLSWNFYNANGIMVDN